VVGAGVVGAGVVGAGMVIGPAAWAAAISQTVADMSTQAADEIFTPYPFVACGEVIKIYEKPF
jgi:hypothetical protein